MPKLFSSKQIIDILYRNGFVFISQKGSHAKFARNDKTVIVPTPKKEIPMGTLRSIIRQSGLNADEFN
jgi:predicted RNA binding protein YcfA (HicA-like mRNA interferase family)